MKKATKRKVVIFLVVSIVLIALLLTVRSISKRAANRLALEKGKNPISGEDYSQEEIDLNVNAAAYIDRMKKGLADCYWDCALRCRMYQLWDEELDDEQLAFVANEWKRTQGTDIVDEITSRWRTGCGYGESFGENIVNRLQAMA